MRHYSWEALWQELLNAQRLLSAGNDPRYQTKSNGSNHLHINNKFNPAEIAALADTLVRRTPKVDTLCFQGVMPPTGGNDERAQQTLAKQVAFTAAACLLLRALPSLPSLRRLKLQLTRHKDQSKWRYPLTGWVSPRGINLVMAALADAVGRCTALTNVDVVVEDDGESSPIRHLTARTSGTT